MAGEVIKFGAATHESFKRLSCAFKKASLSMKEFSSQMQEAQNNQRLRPSASQLAAMLLHADPTLFKTMFKQRTEKPSRPCVVCGKPKYHNNSYCSAACCRKDREDAKS